MAVGTNETLDTIVAISTPPGRGGIGVVRLAGPSAIEVAERLVRVKHSLRAPEAHGRAYFCRVVDPEGYGWGDSRPAHDDEAVMNGAPGKSGSAGILDGANDATMDNIGSSGETQIPFGNDKQKKDEERRDLGNHRATIDDAIVTVFHAPRSYTGDDLVEIAAHGSPVILEAILRGALAWEGQTEGEGQTQIPLRQAQGNDKDKKVVRLAGPGEFTQRAFLSGRLDLTQAEAVHDLISAQTLDQARVAAQQMGGALSRRVAPAKEGLLHLIALLEAGMDFASGELDDVDVVPPGEIAAAIDAVRKPLAALAATFQRGQLLRNGAAIALVGRPNAGKSSLFNRLLERERAIVTPIAGTTRDTLEETLALGGVPLRLIDTAGLREIAGLRGDGGQDGLPTHDDKAVMDGAPNGIGGPDEVEILGMQRTQEALADADLVLYIKDVSGAEGGGEGDLPLPEAGRPYLVVHNKIDLVEAGESGSSGAKAPDLVEGWDVRAEARTLQSGMDGVIRTSALTGEGLEELRAAILKALQANGPVAETGLLNNVRQQQAVLATLGALEAAAGANGQGLPHEVILMDLHSALQGLDSLTGTTTPDDILARIFSTFCIGK